MTSLEKLQNITQEHGNLIIGLDPDITKMPKPLIKSDLSEAGKILEFNKQIIDATYDICMGYKPNFAFFEAFGWQGVKSYIETFEYIKHKQDSLFRLADMKRGDIDNTNIGSAKMAFEHCDADAMTLAPFMGGLSLKPFWDVWKEKLFFILACTSNEGAGQFQDRQLDTGETLSENVVEQFMKYHNIHNNIGFVTGATYPEKIAIVNNLAPNSWKLLPGIGKQGGALFESIKGAANKEGSGFIINSSREILYASSDEDFAQKAREKTLFLCGEIKGTCERVMELRTQTIH